MCSSCSRRALARSRCFTTVGNGATGNTLLATATWSRSSPSASPRIRSLLPSPYTSAVSKNVTPKARARRTISGAGGEPVAVAPLARSELPGAQPDPTDPADAVDVQILHLAHGTD